MTSELKPLYDLLSGQFGWLPGVVGWLLAVQMAVQFFSGRLQSRLTEKVVEVARTGDADQEALFCRLLTSPLYRLTAFALDLAFRLKLPAKAEFTKRIAERKQLEEE